MRNGIFALFAAAMLTVTLAPRGPRASHAAVQQKVDGLRVRVAWLAERESALGDWESVRPPLRPGDELQLTVLAAEDVCVYLYDGRHQQVFPPPDAPRTRACIRGSWPYALPGPHQTWRLDAAEHDSFHLVAARRPLDDPAALIDGSGTTAQPAPDLELPLHDGRRGAAAVRVLTSADVIVDRYDAR